MERLLPQYPDITIEILVDKRLTDIVAERLDAGVRLGERLAKDMVAGSCACGWRASLRSTPARPSRLALAGAGLALVLEDRIRDDLEAGRLIRVLADWCPPFSDFHLYYPSRRQSTPAFAVVVDALRYRG